jgi:hypothetical protein
VAMNFLRNKFYYLFRLVVNGCICQGAKVSGLITFKQWEICRFVIGCLDWFKIFKYFMTYILSST